MVMLRTFQIANNFETEPTSGVDPLGKRILWRAIAQVRKSASILLTTHSMEEADALCTKIGILVNGELQCIGSPSQLKEKHGTRFQVELICIDEEEFIFAEICKHFGDISVILVEKFNQRLRLEIMKSLSLTISSVFEFMEILHKEMKIEDYSVGYPTLDQIFIRFAKNQVDAHHT
jgi:ABC-type multidrug transport system ATPase subunit